MQSKEIYYDRRRNERRQDRSADSAFEKSLPDQNRRHGDRRCNPGRRNERQNLSLEVSILCQVGKTINVSERGVLFEVITNAMNVLSPGTTIPLKIAAANSTLGYDGRGTVIRNCIIENPDRDDSLCVALELKGNLILY